MATVLVFSLFLRCILNFGKFSILIIYLSCRSKWPRGLRRRSAAARMLRMWVRISPRTWKSVCCECCMLSGRGLCEEPITRPEESYRLCCVVVCDSETSWMRRTRPPGREGGGLLPQTQKNIYLQRVRCLQAGVYNAMIQASRIPGSQSNVPVFKYQYWYRKCRLSNTNLKNNCLMYSHIN
jgi:hypothetical protein